MTNPELQYINNEAYVLKSFGTFKMLVLANQELESVKMINAVLQEASGNFPEYNQIMQLIYFALVQRALWNAGSRIAKLKFLYATAILQAQYQEIESNPAASELVKVY